MKRRGMEEETRRCFPGFLKDNSVQLSPAAHVYSASASTLGGGGGGGGEGG